METLAFIFSSVGTVCVCIPPLLKGKNMKFILLFVFVSNATVGVSYVLTGALNGAVSCFLGAAQSIVNYFFDRKNKPLPLWLIATYAFAFTLANLLVFKSATDTLAVVACLIFVVCICQKNGRKYRVWSLANTVLWIVYDAINASFGPLVTHSVLLVLTICGIILHDVKAKEQKQP